ncbi:MAG TPA: hypothetical protein VGG99_19980 [Acetobacteraceae bacterium]|jgi:hypothetical protein
MNSATPDWVRVADHPVIVRTCHGTTGSMVFEGASPHLVGDHKDLFLAALRRDVTACDVEPARPTFREVPRNPRDIAPETCAPYVDANALGYYLKNTLPLVFVRSRAGDVLPNARVAIKYMRENAGEFRESLELLEHHARRIFQPDAYARLRDTTPFLVTDVAQPYAAFSHAHMAMGAGCYAKTPAGLSTFLGPPVNQESRLRVHAGLMESEWHHSELFIVFDYPEFTEPVMVIEPGTVLAQFYFVADAIEDRTEIMFSETDLGADSAYRARSIDVAFDLLRHDKEFVISELTGVKSLSVACPHCWVSVTAAAEKGVPADHVLRQDFYQGYKALRAEYRRARRG